jgi:hypothetical protein
MRVIVRRTTLGTLAFAAVGPTDRRISQNFIYDLAANGECSNILFEAKASIIGYIFVDQD